MSGAKVKGVFGALLKSVKRFPVTVALTTALTICLILRRDVLQPMDVLRVMLILQLGIPVSLIVKLALERLEDLSLGRAFAYYGIGLLFVVLYALFGMPKITPLEVYETHYGYPDALGMTRYLAVSLALYLAAIATPFFSRDGSVEQWVISLIQRFAVSFVFALVLGVGFTAIFATIQLLFSLKYYVSFYDHLWFLIMGIFAPIHFLAGVPVDLEELKDRVYPQALRILMLYIVMPLIVIYTAIISVYFLTILISVSMPQGVVANLVLWYGAVTTLVMFLIHPLKEESRWAQLFTKVLSIWILPLLIMMFVAMGIRIAAHGVTVNRYFVLALGTWVLVSMLYFVFFKGRRNVFLIASLALFVILSVIGPWSAFSVSFASQRNRLTGLLEKYHMLEGGTVKKPDTVVSVDDQVEISSILAYFDQYDGFAELHYLPAGFNLADMEKVFGFRYTRSYGLPDSFRYYSREDRGFIDIAGYDYILVYADYIQDTEETPSENDVRFMLSEDNERLAVFYRNEEIYSLDFGEMVRGLVLNSERTVLSTEEMTFVDENERARIKIVLNHAVLRKGEHTEMIEVSTVTFHLLVALKQPET